MIQGFICGPRLYEFEGWFFEEHQCSGPWPLKKDGEPRKRAGNVFYKMYEKFDRLSDKEKHKYRVGGGYNDAKKIIDDLESEGIYKPGHSPWVYELVEEEKGVCDGRSCDECDDLNWCLGKVD